MKYVYSHAFTPGGRQTDKHRCGVRTAALRKRRIAVILCVGINTITLHDTAFIDGRPAPQVHSGDRCSTENFKTEHSAMHA